MGSPARNPTFRRQHCGILCAAGAAVKMYKGPIKVKNIWFQGFPDGPVVKSPPANARDRGSAPGSGRCHVLWGN